MRAAKGSQTPDLEAMASTGGKLRDLGDQLGAIFPERSDLIMQLIYALATREHVLVEGPFGTGKSDLIQTLFGAFTDSKLFSIALTKFMTESAIIGLPNTKLMQEQGLIQYEREGGILDANFAELDELLDASGPLLRTLLGVLNERVFKRGRQVEGALLHTAVASTNGNAETEILRDPSLGAVVDRFLFRARVDYLSDLESARTMYAQYLNGATPTIQISYDELRAFSHVVVGANQISDPMIIETYARVIEAYRAALRKKDKAKIVSDRRTCKFLQIVEAHALMYGRYDVALEDILAIRWAACVAGDKDGHALFMGVAQPIVDEAIKNQSQGIDDVQRSLLVQLANRVPTVPSDATPDQLVNLSRELKALRIDVEAVMPQFDSTSDSKKKLLEKIVALQDSVAALISG